MHVKLPPSTISKVRLYKFVLYEENILVLLTHLHQNTATLFKPGGLFQVEITCQKQAPNCTINNIKMQKALTVGGGTPSHPPPSLAPLAGYFYRPPKIKSWLRHWFKHAYLVSCRSKIISIS